ncbi:hypothetical protein [Wenxinia marina]|uniref:Uncharacterized protein n=1 Tax=Wenxinia marina DSM 24838 TaxID=1123501 RepID=A0A0D0PEC0_9RHOB|nr:hypothetical protein [Wenxinia marina]KIQ69736.1 hypothetical protein Wenmar_01306 [Wenxinia marina DSM 24838]GGL60799.1 hypothetical protein GCM10011392_14060 [Wenxinia marina]
MAKGDAHDPTGVIAEAYRMEGIGAPECRSIFLDWALALPAGTDQRAAIEANLAEHRPGAEGHPMTGVLEAGLAAPPPARRRGGRRR